MAAPAFATRSEVLHVAEPFVTESGAVLPEITLAFETYGQLDAERRNCVLACHALSGDAHAAGVSDDASASAVDGFGAGGRARGGVGWWDGMIGPGKAFDTDRYFVVCVNVLGSCRGSTGPRSIDPRTGRRYDMEFPVVTVGDMVRAEKLVLDYLGVRRVLATSGGSLGGMQAIEWAVRYPGMVDSCIPIASTARLSPMGLAWQAIGRNAIMADPKWRGGCYDDDDPPAAGLAVARMLGHVTYLSAVSIAEKFGRQLQDRSDYSYTFGNDFAVESYLRYQGDAFTRRFDANSYLYLSRALTYFDVSAERLAKSAARWLVVAFSSDWLYPPEDSRAVVEALRASHRPVTFETIPSTYGHDSFLLEEARQTELIRPFLESVYARA